MSDVGMEIRMLENRVTYLLILMFYAKEVNKRYTLQRDCYFAYSEVHCDMPPVPRECTVKEVILDHLRKPHGGSMCTMQRRRPEVIGVEN